MSYPASDPRRRRIAMTALVLGAITIGFSPIFAVLAIEQGHIGSVSSAFWRIFLALPVFALWLLFDPRTRTLAADGTHGWGLRKGRIRLIIPGLFLGVNLALWHSAIDLTYVANATILANFSAVLVPVISWFWLKERLSPIFAVGGSLAIAGVVWLSLATTPLEGAPTYQTLLGDGLALTAACLYSCYLLGIKFVGSRYTVAELMGYTCAIAAPVLLVIVLITGQPLIPQTARGWLWVIALGLISQTLGQGLIMYAMPRLPASFAAITLLLQPVGTAIWGWIILSEWLTVGQIIAGSIVLVGIYLARIGSGMPSEEKPVVAQSRDQALRTSPHAPTTTDDPAQRPAAPHEPR